MHKQQPVHTRRNIIVTIIALILVGVIFWTLTRKSIPNEPPIQDVVIHVSGETKDSEHDGLKPGEICMKHPDIFVFSYTESGTVNTGSIDKQMQAIQNLAQKGAIALIDESNFKRSLERGCFAGNPLWIVSSLDADTTELLTPIVQKYFVPLFINATDWSSFTGYTMEQIDITNLTSAESLQEILRKYLELQSGGVFKNLE